MRMDLAQSHGPSPGPEFIESSNHHHHHHEFAMCTYEVVREFFCLAHCFQFDTMLKDAAVASKQELGNWCAKPPNRGLPLGKFCASVLI